MRIPMALILWVAVTLVNGFLVNGPLTNVGAQSPSMRFDLADGGVLAGQLSDVKADGRIGIVAKWFGEPIEFPTTSLRECRSIDPSFSTADAGQKRFSVSVLSGDRFVGQLSDWSKTMLTVATDDLGDVSLEADQIVHLADASLLQRRLSQLSHSHWRWACGDGWRFSQDKLGCARPGTAAFGKLELPDRFKVNFVMKCAGQADFEMTLGDRRQDALPNARRGGSRPRLPEERFVTRLEYVGRSVSLVRSNGSVADAAMFHDASSDGTLAMTLFFDQVSGVIAAYEGGLMRGTARLRDEAPVLRRELTFISRGDPVEFSRFDVHAWDGKLPVSETLPQQYVRLADGTVVNGSMTAWDQGQFRLQDQSIAETDLVEAHWTRAEQRRKEGQSGVKVGDVEVLTRSGCRISGRILSSDQAGEFFLQQVEGIRFAVRYQDVIQIRGAPQRIENEVKSTIVSTEGLDLSGHLVSSDSGGLSWKSDLATGKVTLVDRSNAEIQWQTSNGGDGRSQTLELRNGDVISGTIVRADDQTIEMHQTVAGTIRIPTDDVVQLNFDESDPVEPSLFRALLTIPRRIEDDPPTHLLIATHGDAVRGRLISMNESEVTLEVRSLLRVIPRDRLASVIRLVEPLQTIKPSMSAVWARQSDRMGFKAVRLDGNILVGQHATFGECRIAVEDMKRLRLGDRDLPPATPWKLTPAKQPRTFGE